MPTVEGHCVPGGYSAQAVKRSRVAHGEPTRARACLTASRSAASAVSKTHDALEFMLLGSSTVQICTGVMLQGVKMIDELKEGVEKFMVDKGFRSVGDRRQESSLLFNAWISCSG